MKTQYIPDGWGFDSWVHPKGTKQRNKGLKLFVVCVLVILVGFGLTSCRAPKDTMVQIEQNEDTKKVTDIELNIDNQLNEAISQAAQKVLNEKLQVKLQEIEYDTDKPVDPTTGKPPVKKETNIDLTKETEATSQEISDQQKNESTRSKLTDKSKEDTKIVAKQKAETKAALKWWQKMFIAIGVVALSVIISIVIHALTAKKHIKYP